MRANKANASAKHNGADLVLRELASGISQNIGNVNLYDFDDAGRMLAYTVDAAERVGNGVYVVDLATSQSKVLSSASLDYDQLTWGDKGASLAVLRGDKKKENLQRDNTLLVWQDVSAAKPTRHRVRSVEGRGFPKGYVLSEFAALRWTRDGSRIYVGLKDQEADPGTPAPSADPKANVDVWHWKDNEVQSVQIVRLAQERRATLPAVFNVASGKLVRIADERDAQRHADARSEVGDRPHRHDVSHRSAVGRQQGGLLSRQHRRRRAHADRQGAVAHDGQLARRQVVPVSQGQEGLRLQHRDGARASNLGSGDKISFVDADDDHPYEKPTYGVAGWSKDGKSVILNHRYDLYSVPLDGGKPVNLTGGVGDAQQIVFRLVRLDRAGGGGRGGRGGGGGAFGRRGRR